MSESLTVEATESSEDLQGVEQTTTEEVGDNNNAPAIDRPEWLLDKYATGERSQDEAIIEQAKAYKEAEKRLGSFLGAPEEYSLTLPDGVEGDVDTELAAYQEFIEEAKKSNMNNDTAQRLFNIFVGYQQSMVNQLETDYTEQRKLLGENADDRIRGLVSWAGNNLSEEQVEVMHTMTMTADQVEVLEAMISKTRNSKLPGSQQAPTLQESYSWDDYHKAVGDPRYKTDKVFRERHKRLASQLG
jgi:hypothetical protein